MCIEITIIAHNRELLKMSNQLLQAPIKLSNARPAEAFVISAPSAILSTN